MFLRETDLHVREEAALALVLGQHNIGTMFNRLYDQIEGLIPAQDSGIDVEYALEEHRKVGDITGIWPGVVERLNVSFKRIYDAYKEQNKDVLTPEEEKLFKEVGRKLIPC